MPTAEARKRMEQNRTLTIRVKGLVEGGMPLEQALKANQLSETAYKANVKKLNGGSHGSMRADQLPPRPRKNKRGGRHEVDMNSIRSVALRLNAIDARLRTFTGLRVERKKMADRLMQLLKANP